MTQVKSSLSLKNYLSFSNEILEARVNVWIRTTWMLMSSVGFISFFFHWKKESPLVMFLCCSRLLFFRFESIFVSEKKCENIFTKDLFRRYSIFFSLGENENPIFFCPANDQHFFVMNMCQRRQEGIKTVVCSDWKMFISRLNERKKSDGHLNHFFRERQEPNFWS